jgi:hypothetical protein
MSYKEWSKWLFVSLFGFAALFWDAMMFWTIIAGNGESTISESRVGLVWGEFIGVSMLAVVVFIIGVNHFFSARKIHKDFVA